MLNVAESVLIAHPERAVPEATAKGFRQLIDRRLEGEPVAYLLGEREFWGRSFLVDDRVLVPRPETEHLVELALESIGGDRPRILDLGVGSGCLAVTLALELPGVEIWAVDRSVAALAVADRNRHRHRVGSQVHLVASDWGASLRLESFGLLISNPPYVDRASPCDYEEEVARFEPGEALFAERKGLGSLVELFALVRQRSPTTPLLTEIGRGQLGALTLEAERFGLVPSRVVHDYAGIERAVLWQNRHNPLRPGTNAAETREA